MNDSINRQFSVHKIKKNVKPRFLLKRVLRINLKSKSFFTFVMCTNLRTNEEWLFRIINDPISA